MRHQQQHLGICKAALRPSAILCLLVFAAWNMAAAQGDLDRTFSGDGKLTDWSGEAKEVAIQPDGKIVVAGYVQVNASNYDLAVARYNPDGSSDTTFGGGTGRVTTNIDEYDDAFDLAIQADGKIVVVGESSDYGGNFCNGFVIRYSSDGSLDTSFANDGIISTPTCDVTSVAIQPADGKIVVIGWAGYRHLIRYNSEDGSLDTSFGAGGTANTNMWSWGGHGLGTVDIQTDGKILALVGYSVDGDLGTYRALVRYNSNGLPDIAFGTNGRVNVPVFNTDVAIGPDGKIVTAGSGSSAVVRYNPNGSLDTGFGSNGTVTTPNFSAADIAIQSDGMIVAAGSSFNIFDYDFALVRYDPNGTRDNTFGGGDGFATVDFNTSDDSASEMALDAEGRAVVVGGSDGKVAIARFLLAPTLHRNGKIAFTSDRDGNREIYLMNPDGSNQTRLTNNTIIDDFPTWSPDGRRIAFLSQRPTGEFAIFIMNADGTGKTEVTPVSYQSPSPWRGFDWRHMSWSPDGNRIVFTDLVGTIGTIFVVNADGNNRRNLTTGFYPAWSPDGSKILFVKASTPNPFYNLHTIRPDGTELQFIPTSFPNGYILWDSPPMWSPDGLKIGIVASDSANSDLYIANADGSNPQPIVYVCPSLVSEGCGANSLYPAWSPNGRTIVFAMFAADGTEIYLKSLAPGNQSRITNTTGSNSNPSWQPLDPSTTPYDFDGDGRTDTSVFRPSEGKWYLNRSTEGINVVSWGLTSDRIVPADYDGDGKTDTAVFRPSNGTWYVINSATNTFDILQWGLSGDIPVPGDYDGDGQADRAVFRYLENDYGVDAYAWYVLKSSGGMWQSILVGQEISIPVPQDYDGDKLTDRAVYYSGLWQIERNDGSWRTENWGLPGDIAVPADYDGDGKADIAVWRPSDRKWYIRYLNGNITVMEWGLTGDIPVPGDYDGDGKTDPAVYRNGAWYLFQTTNGISVRNWGLADDRPIPAAYLR